MPSLSKTTNQHSPSLDSTHNVSPFPASSCQVGQVKALHQMKQRDVVPFSQLALSLPETGNKFTITCHSYSLVDPVSVFRRFQQVPKLVSQKRAVPVLGQPRIRNFLLVSATLTVQDG